MQETTERQGKWKTSRKLWGQQRKAKLHKKEWSDKKSGIKMIEAEKNEPNEPQVTFLGESQDLVDM